MNDRNGLKRDSAKTEASATFTEASAEASAESLPKNGSELRKNGEFFTKNLISQIGPTSVQYISGLI